MTIWLPLLGIILIVALVVYLNMNSTTAPRAGDERRYGGGSYKSYGKLEPAEEPKAELGTLATFKGTGPLTSDTFFMGAGIYYIVCQFPPQTRINVDLMNVQDASVKTIASVSGFATLSFSVKVSQKYCLHILTNENDAQWAVLIKPF
jgi:hypothetical protein